MRIMFTDAQGGVFDTGDYERVPRTGEGVNLRGRQFMVGAVNTLIEDGDVSYSVTLLSTEQAAQYLGGQR